MYYKIINLIRINLKLNNKIVKTKLIKSDFEILNIFIKLNIIKNIKLIENNEYMLYLNNDSSFKEFKNLYKPSKPVKINLKSIINNNKKNKSIFYMTTVKGLINNIEAENLKVGGFLILKIFL